MKIDLKTAFFKSVCLFLFGTAAGCAAPKYLPEAGGQGLNAYGSYIRVYPKNPLPTVITGELISVDSARLILLAQRPKGATELVAIPTAKVARFTLKHSKIKSNYLGLSSVYALSTFSHGNLMFITLPLNSLVFLFVAASSATEVQYNERSMSYKELKMFARFPQGIPANIPLDSIKR